MLAKLISYLPYPCLRFYLVRALYKTKSLKLEDLKVFHEGRFWLHKVGGIYFATENLNWFRSFSSFYDDCIAVSLKFYRLHPGDIVFDVGAGLGEETLVYANIVGSEGKVISIEANPIVCDILRQVVLKNCFNNVLTLNIAISEICGKVKIEDFQNNYLQNTISNKSSQSKSYEIDSLGMDDLIELLNLPEINLLKVNIEGAEKYLVNSLDRMFNRVRNFAIACHDFRYKRGESEFFCTRQHVIDYFAHRGLDVKWQSTGVPFIDDWIYVHNPVNSQNI